MEATSLKKVAFECYAVCCVRAGKNAGAQDSLPAVGYRIKENISHIAPLRALTFSAPKECREKLHSNASHRDSPPK